MKLVLATPLYPPEIGGPATYAKALIDGLSARGIEVELVKFSDVRRLPKFIRHYVYFRRILRSAKKADAVFALDPVSTGLPAMKAARKAGKAFFVKIVGDYAWEQGRQRFGVREELDEFVKAPHRNFFVRRLQKIQTRVAASATRIVVPSEYLKTIVSAWGISQETIDIIYNGIELPINIALPANRPSGFLVVSAGRRVPWKGFEALERVVARESGWHLFIASGMPRAQVLGWMRTADVFVLNSSYEGLSHALLEAMILGTPIVATAAGGNSELIKDGETGILIPPGDDDALSIALRATAANLDTARRRAAAAQKFAERFSVPAMLDATAALLQSI